MNICQLAVVLSCTHTYVVGNGCSCGSCKREQATAINYSWAFNVSRVAAKMWREVHQDSHDIESSGEHISKSSRPHVMDVATNRQTASEVSVDSGSPCAQASATNSMICTRVDASEAGAFCPLQSAIATRKLATASSEVHRASGSAWLEVTSLSSSKLAAAIDIKPRFVAYSAASIASNLR